MFIVNRKSQCCNVALLQTSYLQCWKQRICNKNTRYVYAVKISIPLAIFAEFFIQISYFLSCVSILMRDIDIANLSVCMSVHYVPVSDENGLIHRQFFHRTVAQSF